MLITNAVVLFGALFFSDNAITEHSFFSCVGVSSEDFTSREGYKTQMLCPSQISAKSHNRTGLAGNICKKKNKT